MNRKQIWPVAEGDIAIPFVDSIIHKEVHRR